MAEIDDIFASKGKSKAVIVNPSTSVLPDQKPKASKKRKRVADLPALNQSDTCLAPETVVDSSTASTHAKRPKFVKAAAMKNSATGKKKMEYDTERKFHDSRGSESRRKTEEGWAIYKEDELGIHDRGGDLDTPLCPFDCECCF